MQTINFYNHVKKIIIRSGGPDKVINIRIFTGLVQELRIKFDITSAGLAAEKTMRKVNQGLKLASKSDSKVSKGLKKQRQRVERIVLKEFNMINMSRV